MIYFDNAATSFVKPQLVCDAVNFALKNYTANAGRSGHKPAQQTAEIVYNTREIIKKFFNASNYDVIYTKNCTEALNLAIFGTLTKGDHVITTCYEHNSVLRPLENLKTKGVEVTVLDCNLIDVPNNLQQNLQPNTKMIITTATSNVTGEVCNLKEVSKFCKQHNLTYLIDGAQSSGHMEINLDDLGADFYAFAGHKGLYSITGVGGLIVKNGTKLKPLLCGGTGTESENLIQPNDIPEGYEAGTLPIIPIISLGAGVEYLTKNFKQIKTLEKDINTFAFKELSKLKFLKLYSKESSQNVFAFNVAEMDSSLVANLLNDEFGICVRAGLHCAPLIHKKMGTIRQGAVRVSLDFFNTFAQINYLIYALKQIYIKYN